MKNFRDLSLKAEVIDALEKMGITEPTTIQEKTIPLVLEEEKFLNLPIRTGNR